MVFIFSLMTQVQDFLMSESRECSLFSANVKCLLNEYSKINKRETQTSTTCDCIKNVFLLIE